ncbi:hypothetical protein I553_5122 [Mycobacterium xenopi 4042]|uniref:Uncharacterized protein n=1 Tax=Mycobacterium xenopi 4042 TaxID=1299334 RepID=X7ZUN4_MYCXE|nr:hypothetical protein I553_5122 [Mycobacterium xenopi 4042]
MLDGLLCDPDAAAIVTVAGDFTATWTRSELLRMAAGAIEVLDANDVARVSVSRRC